MDAVKRFVKWLVQAVMVFWMTGCWSFYQPPQPGAIQLAEGQVEALQNGTTLWVIRQAFSGATSTFILYSEELDLAFFAAPIKGSGGWGTVVLNMARELPLSNLNICSNGQGTFYACRDMGDLVAGALNKGYMVVRANEFAAMYPAFSVQLASAVGWVSRITVSPLVVPLAETLRITDDLILEHSNELGMEQVRP